MTVSHAGCGGALELESQPRWVLTAGTNPATTAPMVRGTESLARCAKCGRVGVLARARRRRPTASDFTRWEAGGGRG